MNMNNCLCRVFDNDVIWILAAFLLIACCCNN